METNRLAVIAVVVAVIIAGIGVSLFITNNDKGGVTIDAALEVYGNANNDDRIDQADIVLIEEIISGSMLFGSHPLADADCDGSVTEEDIAQVRKILAADSSNKVRVHHINHIDGRSEVADTLYPVTAAIGTGAANSILIYKYLGIVEELKGLAWDLAPDRVLFSEYAHLITEGQRLGAYAHDISLEKASNLVTTEGVTAAITADNGVYMTGENEFEEAGIDVIRVQSAAVNGDRYMSTVLMIAFLFDTDGKGYMDKCVDLIDWYEEFLTGLDSKLSGIKNKVSAVASSISTGVSANRSDYTDVLRAAGATFPLTDMDAAAVSKTYNVKNNDTWLNAYDPDYVICLRTSTAVFSWYGGTALTDGADTLKAYMGNWSTLQCYENNNVFVICGEMPVFLRIAYAAQTLYGDAFEEDYAYNLHVEFVEKFFGWDESIIKGKAFVVSMEDLGISS